MGYRLENRAGIRASAREHYKQNNKEINEKQRGKYQDDACYRNNKITRSREHHTSNLDEINKRRKIHRDNNKKEINGKKMEHYYNNKEEYKVKNKEAYKKKKINKCVICGTGANDRFCGAKCQGIGMSGKNSPHWQGGKSFEPYPINWTARFKRQIRKRDTYLCAMCNRHQDEFNRSHCVHHIDGDKLNTTEKNCISLCVRHHGIVEVSGDKKYTFWMPKFQKMLSKLYGYNYE